MNYRKGLLTALLAPVISFGGAVATVHASGYAVFTHGASALGQGNAVTAHATDPSTIFYNPALMNKLDGTQFQVGTTAIFSSREYESSLPGGSPASNDSTHFPSTFYATHKLNDKVSMGLGVFNPFGLGTEWDGTWDGRYLATKSELTTFNINPNVSYRVLPRLTVAAGIDFILLDATLERKVINSAVLGIPGQPFDFNGKFEGDGTGVGFNLGLAYDINKDITFGVSYRSQVVVDINGDSSTSPAIPQQAVDAFPALALANPGETSVTLPPQVTAGIAYQVSDPLKIEAGVRWEGWSTFKELTISLDNGNSVTTPRNWKDSWGGNVGGRYQVDETVALLAGYVYGDTSVPDNTFDPTIPDAKTHVFCAGTDLNFHPFTVAASYGYQLYENRTKSNGIDSPVPTATSSANGKYKTDAHLVALSLGYKF